MTARIRRLVVGVFFAIALCAIGGSEPRLYYLRLVQGTTISAQTGDLFTRRSINLTSGVPEITGTLDLDPQTEWIEVAIDRPTSVSSGIVWASGTQIGVSIQILVDGQLHEAKGRSSGGIRVVNSTEVAAYRLRWNTPSGYFGGATGKRLCETRLSTCQVRIHFELLRGTTLTSFVTVRSANSALILPTRHNSVAYDNASSAIEESGDGVVSFSITSTGSDRAALVAVGSRGTSLAGTLAITGGGETIGSTIWDVVDGGLSVNSRGYPITNQATGAQTLTSDLTATTSTDHFLGIVTMTGVSQGTPTGNTCAAAPAFDVSPSCTIASGVSSSDLVVDFLLDQNAPTVGADQTERVNPANTSFPTYYRMSTQPGSVSPATMSWTHSTDATRALNAVVFKAQPTVALTGTITASTTESDVVTGGKTIILTATDDTFVDNMAELSYVGGQDNSFAGTTANTDITFSLTGGSASTPAAGDLVVVTFCTGSVADRTLAITNTGGTAYTLIDSELYSNDTFDTNMRVAYRFMPGTPETAVRFAGGSGNAQDAATYAIQVFRNVDTSTPMDVAATSVSAANQNTRLIDPPSITPSTAGAWIGISGCAAGGTLTADFTNPGDVVDFRTDGQADTNDSGVAAWHYTSWTSGPYDHAALTGGGTDTTNDSYASVAWVLRPATDSAFDNQRDELRDGCDSAQSEGTGWDALKTTTMPVGNVVRTSATIVTVTLAAAGSYNITAQETITCTVPSGILSGGVSVVATPTFTIDAGGGSPPPCIPRMSTLGVSSCGDDAAGRWLSRLKREMVYLWSREYVR